MASTESDSVVVALHLQNEVLHPDGKIRFGFAEGAAGRDSVIKAAKAVLEGARRRGVPVVSVRISFRPDFKDVIANCEIFRRVAASGAMAEGSRAIFRGNEFLLTHAVLVALAPLIVVWFGLGLTSKVINAALIAFFPLLVNTMVGLRSADEERVSLMRSLAASERQIFWHVLLPGAAPSIFAGLRIALPIALVVVIITEMIGESRGLGYYISYASASFEYANAFAGVAAVALIGFTLDRVLVWARNRIVFWERGAAFIGAA